MAEKRLIDANDIKYEKKTEYFGHGEFFEVQKVYKEDIDKMPTVDAVEVVHGRWIGVDSSYWRWAHDGGHTVEHITYRCSECGRKSIIKTNYCPNCGATMDGDGNG